MSTSYNKMANLIEKIEAECKRIAEDAEYSAKRHFNAACRWASYNNRLGIPSVVVAAIASTLSFASIPTLGGILAALTGSLTAVLTFLKPAERSTAHNAIGNQYLRLRNEARIFLEIDLANIDNVQELIEKFKQLIQRRDDLNESAPITADKDYEKAKKGIENGQTKYKVDQL